MLKSISVLVVVAGVLVACGSSGGLNGISKLGADFVRAFNQDRPYDRFIREQLAGDAFRAYGDEGRIGLGFLHQWVNQRLLYKL